MLSASIFEILTTMANAPGCTDILRPEWFAAFLADRGTRKPSAHTIKAYRQDFDAIATLVAGDAAAVARMPLADITTDSMRTAFAQYAETQPNPVKDSIIGGQSDHSDLTRRRQEVACLSRDDRRSI